MAINCSARESHYSERHYFCNIFFRFVSNEIQLQNFVVRRVLKITFYKRKRLLNERIRDHITRISRSICMSELSRMRSSGIRIHSKIRVFRNRSPNVWRTMFVLKFDGPTISRAHVKQLDHEWRLVRERSIS